MWYEGLIEITKTQLNSDEKKKKKKKKKKSEYLLYIA